MSPCARGTPWLAAPALDRGETQLLLPVPAWGALQGGGCGCRSSEATPGTPRMGIWGLVCSPVREFPLGGLRGGPGGLLGALSWGEGSRSAARGEGTGG